MKQYLINLALALTAICGLVGLTLLAVLPVMIFGCWGVIGTAIIFVAYVVAIWTFSNDEEWR